MVLRKKLHNQLEDMKGKIRVLCRVRPPSRKEIAEGFAESCVKDGETTVTVLPPKGGDKKRFTFDSVFEGTGRANSQPGIFEDVRQLVISAVDGYNVCLFAYGQTGSGKTYTMGSASTIGESFDASGEMTEDAGVAPRAAAAIFEILDERASSCDSSVTLTMFEIYCDRLVDLLAVENRQGSLKITLAEHSASGLVDVDGSCAKVVASCAELTQAMVL